jgi:hypothetical protein
MVSRIGLAVVLAFAAVPATSMGSDTYYFIQVNPAYEDSLAASSGSPVLHAVIIEVESDSVPYYTPDSFQVTDIDGIHSLGLLTPSETREGTGRWEDYHDDYPGRAWTSWLLPGYVWLYGEKYRNMYCCSATYRVPPAGAGYVYVRGRAYMNTVNKVMDKWDWRWPSKAVSVGGSFSYQMGYPVVWDEYGYHDWGTAPTKQSHIQGVW